eukprot:9160465-Alexandrium_andersonii.AAC.1
MGIPPEGGGSATPGSPAGGSTTSGSAAGAGPPLPLAEGGSTAMGASSPRLPKVAFLITQIQTDAHSWSPDNNE